MPADSSTPNPPPGAPGEEEPRNQEGLAAFQSLPAEALRLLRLSAIAQALVVFVILTGADLGARYGAEIDLPWPPLLPAVVAGLLLGGVGLWWAQRSFRAWRYVLEPDRLRVEHGVITTRSAVLPRSRVQHVSSERGPVQRLLGLVTLTVHTAGANTPNVSIPNLLDEQADALRRELIGGRS